VAYAISGATLHVDYPLNPSGKLNILPRTSTTSIPSAQIITSSDLRGFYGGVFTVLADYNVTPANRGGWDDYGIKIFSDAVEISGPSKFLFRPIVKVNKLMIKSPLHNRFGIPWKAAQDEAEELMKERFVKVYPTARNKEDVQMLREMGFNADVLEWYFIENLDTSANLKNKSCEIPTTV